MSMTVVSSYVYLCEKCGVDQVEEDEELPYGWDQVNGHDLCDSCFIEYDILDDEDKEDFMENVPI